MAGKTFEGLFFSVFAKFLPRISQRDIQVLKVEEQLQQEQT
jgi:hypothetical protein